MGLVRLELGPHNKATVHGHVAPEAEAAVREGKRKRELAGVPIVTHGRSPPRPDPHSKRSVHDRRAIGQGDERSTTVVHVRPYAPLSVPASRDPCNSQADRLWCSRDGPKGRDVRCPHEPSDCGLGGDSGAEVVSARSSRGGLCRLAKERSQWPGPRCPHSVHSRKRSRRDALSSSRSRHRRITRNHHRLSWISEAGGSMCPARLVGMFPT